GAVLARPSPTSVSAARVGWTPSSDSPSQAHATRIATTGSSIDTIAVRVAPILDRAATTSANGTIEPRTIIHATRNQRGACRELRWPSREVLPPKTWPGNDHHGSTTAQKTAANRKPQASSEIGSRPRVP